MIGFIMDVIVIVLPMLLATVFAMLVANYQARSKKDKT